MKLIKEDLLGQFIPTSKDGGFLAPSSGKIIKVRKNFTTNPLKTTYDVCAVNGERELIEEIKPEKSIEIKPEESIRKRMVANAIMELEV